MEGWKTTTTKKLMYSNSQGSGHNWCSKAVLMPVLVLLAYLCLVKQLPIHLWPPSCSFNRLREPELVSVACYQGTQDETATSSVWYQNDENLFFSKPTRKVHCVDAVVIAQNLSSDGSPSYWKYRWLVHLGNALCWRKTYPSSHTPQWVAYIGWWVGGGIYRPDPLS